MHFVVSRYLALLLAIGLAIAETIISWGNWQFAPLWIVDYLMAGCLLYAFYRTRKAENLYTLLAAWAFTLGVFYMDLFVNLDPQLHYLLATVLAIIAVFIASYVPARRAALLPPVETLRGSSA